MAKAASEEQVQLRRRARRRLIGAIALVTVIVVILPWVLEHEPRDSDQDISIQIPSPDATGFNPKVQSVKPAEPVKVPVQESKPEQGEPKPDVQPAAADVLKAEQDKLLAPPQPKVAAAKPTAKEKPPAPPVEPKKNPAEKQDAAADGKGFVVQVTALADGDKAQAIQKDLIGKGLRAYTEVVKTSSGDVTRVRVGPFPNREAAEKERVRLKSLGIDGNVTPR
jgi:DedD protein